MERPAGRADSKIVRLVSPEIFLWGQYTCFLPLGDTRMRLQGALHARVPPSLAGWRGDGCVLYSCVFTLGNKLSLYSCVFIIFFSYFLHKQGNFLIFSAVR